jgi:DNA-binding NtrC family response regulator
MQASAPPKHILTIDDESVIRELLHELFTASGYRVTGASSEDEALRIIRSDSPDLIITDLQLDDADGFDVIEQAKILVPKTPIIVLTGVLFDPAVARSLIGEKIAAYLEKTAPLEQVLKEVKRQLGA